MGLKVECGGWEGGDLLDICYNNFFGGTISLFILVDKRGLDSWAIAIFGRFFCGNS